MTKSSELRILILGLGLAVPGFAGYTTFNFGLNPSSGIAAALPGGSLGWGYSVTNNDLNNWLVLAGLQPTVNFEHVSGITDIFDYPTIAPGGTLTTPWLPDLSGLYQIAWDGSTPSNYSLSGQFVIDAAWYSDDPNVCPQCLVEGPAQTQAIASFTAVTTPEPSPWGLCVVGVAFFAIAKKCRRLAKWASAVETSA